MPSRSRYPHPPGIGTTPAPPLPAPTTRHDLASGRSREKDKAGEVGVDKISGRDARRVFPTAVSFPRTRESIFLPRARCPRQNWIPAFAGMTPWVGRGLLIPEPSLQRLWVLLPTCPSPPGHSRARGNLRLARGGDPQAHPLDLSAEKTEIPAFAGMTAWVVFGPAHPCRVIPRTAMTPVGWAGRGQKPPLSRRPPPMPNRS